MPDTITAREANQQFSRLLSEVAAGRSFVITRHGVPVARLAPEPTPTGERRLTPAQERALAETIACLRGPREPVPDGPLPSSPRDLLYDEVLAERGRVPE